MKKRTTQNKLIKKLDLKGDSSSKNEDYDPVKTFDSQGSFSFKNKVGNKGSQFHKDEHDDTIAEDSLEGGSIRQLNGSIVSEPEKEKTDDNENNLMVVAEKSDTNLLEELEKQDSTDETKQDSRRKKPAW